MKCQPIITKEIETLRKCLLRKKPCYMESHNALESVQIELSRRWGPYDFNENIAVHRSARHEGMYRWVVDLGNGCIMKIPKGSMGAESNRAEVRAWLNILKTKKRTLINTFAPIHAAGKYGEYVVMPKVDIHTMVDRNRIYRVLDKNHVRCEDLHRGNVGLYNGRPVILDYGFGVKCTIRRKH